MSAYQTFLRPLLFRLDPERIHNLAIAACELSGRVPLFDRAAASVYSYKDERLQQDIAGITFPNPLGLAAGFDKNGRAIKAMSALGFGHIEIGSVSAFVSHGNTVRPRLFRIPQDRGVVVYYGVPNEGADAVAQRLSDQSVPVPVGINLVKTNDPTRPSHDEEVLQDYTIAFEKLKPHADYITLNMSCPNSEGDRNFFDELPKVHTLLERLQTLSPQVPVLLKLKPTLDRKVLCDIVEIADDFSFVAGFGINLPAGKPTELNVTTPRTILEKMPGAVSGKPIEDFINAVLAELYQVIGPNSRYALIAAGGVFTAEDAYRKIRLGASLVQLYTALIYRGPVVVKEILVGLVQLLERDGYENIAQTVGTEFSLQKSGAMQ